MPPLKGSRYSFCSGFLDDNGRLYLSDREPFVFRELADNRLHSIVVGDTLHSLAERYFPSFDDAANLWWVIADFQPERIQDPTITLSSGTTAIIPSERTVREQVFNPARRAEHTA